MGLRGIERGYGIKVQRNKAHPEGEPELLHLPMITRECSTVSHARLPGDARSANSGKTGACRILGASPVHARLGSPHAHSGNKAHGLTPRRKTHETSPEFGIPKSDHSHRIPCTGRSLEFEVPLTLAQTCYRPAQRIEDKRGPRRRRREGPGGGPASRIRRVS